MCGIWGVSDTGASLDRRLLLKIIKELMILSETRGKDASGIAVMHDGELNVLRKAMSSHELLNELHFVKYAEKNILNTGSKNIWVTGHSRLVTNGTQYNPNNNQPIAKKHIALVHNGIIVNENKLWENMPDASKDYEVDSEAILETFNHKLSRCGNVEMAIRETYHDLKGMSSTIMLVQKGHYMIATSNNGSLYYVRSKDEKLVIFASESLMLEKLISEIQVLRDMISTNPIRQLKSGESIIISDRYNSEIKDIEIIQDEKKDFVLPNLNDFNFSKYEIDFDKIQKIRRCTKCVLPETMPFIEFDNKGVCNYCHGYHKAEYKGIGRLREWNKEYTKKGGKAMVSFSGGRDSSYGLHYFVKEMGIKPIAYCYDWGMVTDIARRNQSRMCEQLGIEFILVSADIKKKRKNIRKNVSAWLKKPSLGMVPLFMAGDKHYFYYANKVRTDYNLDTILLATNPFEKTYFKSGFCGVMPDILKREYKKMDLERLPIGDVLRMSGYYAGQFVKNPSYVNSSVIDTFTAAISFYVIPHNYFRLFDYIPWNEKTVDEVLMDEYGWECAEDSKSTWRIGDGTAPFYNYIYCMVAGLTENDTLRSNQVREGMLTREEALGLVYRDNQPRFDSMKWYFDAISMDMADALSVINRIPKLYGRN
ncbi:MAG: hypothetical protein HDQ96_09740 [Lachnospiraceae bacterium]|nr:hypothetical protein [Lachnospiraceae bacterium]